MWCSVHFFHHVKFFFRFRQQIGFPLWGQLCCGCQGEESKKFCSGNIHPIEGRLTSKVVFHQRSSSVKGHIPSKVVFSQRSYSVKGRLPSKVVFRQRLSSVKGCCPSKVFFRQRIFNLNLFNLIWLYYRVWHSSAQSFIFFSSIWSTSITSIICLFELGHPNDLNGDVTWRH